MRDLRCFFVLALLFTLWTGLTGCSRPLTTPSVAVSPAAAAPRRIVALAPSVTELLYALGVGNRLAGTTAYSDYPPEAARLPRVGDSTLDFERLMALSPDLVVAESITPAEQMRRLRELHLPLLCVDSSTLAGYRDTVRQVAAAVGAEPAGARVLRDLDAALAACRQHARTPRPRVFVEIASRPLMTAAHGTFVDEIVTAAGGMNVFGELDGKYPAVDPEALLARQPQLVVLTDVKPDEFLSMAGLSVLHAPGVAVQRIDADLLVRPGPRLPLGLQQLADWLRQVR
jgi:iron complex transport system substrate-binding protein